MHRLLSPLGMVLMSGIIAYAQPEENSRPSSIGYPNVAAALDAMRAKSGVTVASQSGWTVIEDRAAMSIWSFTHADHSAHPAAVRRTIMQKGSDLFVQMAVLCEATKSACDKLVAEFEALNNRMRERLGGKRTP